MVNLTPFLGVSAWDQSAAYRHSDLPTVSEAVLDCLLSKRSLAQPFGAPCCVPSSLSLSVNFLKVAQQMVENNQSATLPGTMLEYLLGKPEESEESALSSRLLAPVNPMVAQERDKDESRECTMCSYNCIDSQPLPFKGGREIDSL